MNKLYVLLMFIALAAYVACQRQQMEEQAQEQHQVTQGEAKPNGQEKAPETVPIPDSSASPEKRYDLKSQAQKFQPRRVVPMTSPIEETPTPTPTPSEPPTEKRSQNEAENQKSDARKQ